VLVQLGEVHHILIDVIKGFLLGGGTEKDTSIAAGDGVLGNWGLVAGARLQNVDVAEREGHEELLSNNLRDELEVVGNGGVFDGVVNGLISNGFLDVGGGGACSGLGLFLLGGHEGTSLHAGDGSKVEGLTTDECLENASRNHIYYK
jgi:hypothetical protein